MTVRAVWPRPRRCSASRVGHPPQLVVQALAGRRRPAGTSPRARSRCARPRPRAAAGRSRARGRAACRRPCPAAARAELVVGERRERADRLDAGRAPAAPPRAARSPAAAGSGAARGTRPRVPGARSSARPACGGRRRSSRRPSSVASPSEHESCVRARTTACTASASARASSKRRRDLAELEVALVDARPARPSARSRGRATRPRCEYSPVERRAAAARTPRRAAPQRLGARHRRVDPERGAPT